MRRTRFCVAVFAALLAAGGGKPARAQSSTGTVEGTVRAQGGAGLENVRVVLTGTTRGAVTRADGRYLISGVEPGAYRIRAVRLGYAAREASVTVTAEQTATLDFELAPTATELNPVVSIGYGTVQRSDVTGSITSVSTSEISTMPVQRVEMALSGLVSGVQVQTTNAQPGAQLRIRVRGSNSLSASNDPLVVIDGVIGADLNQVDPNDIESMDVLKDASSTAIYGARAASGVILVTTKRGRPDAIRFEYSGYSGAQAPSKYIPVLTADEFALLYMRNPNRDKSISFDTTQSIPNTDWQRRTYQTAPMSSNEIRISGTSGNTNLMLSAGVLNQQGIVRNSNFNRGTLRFNLDQTIGNRFRVGTRLNYSRARGDQARVNDGYGSAGGPVTMMALRFAPTIPVYDSVGNFSGPLLPTQTMDNPVALVNLRKDKEIRDYLIGNLFGEYDLVSGLTLRSSLGYTSNNFTNNRYVSRLLWQSLNNGQANIDNSRGVTWLSENTATLRRKIGEHDFSLLGGFTAQQADNSTANEQGVGFTSDQLGYRRINLATTITATSSASRIRQLSGLGRANYSFRDRYLLTGTLRTDGSSKFAMNHKWATFPSGAIAWRASDEPFLAFMRGVVDALKFRASTGRTGVEAISAYQSLAAWSVGTQYTVGTTRFQNGALLTRIANPDLRWETTTQNDGGLDLVMFSNRLSLTFDAYDKVTHDLLYDKLVPYYTGYEDFTTNIGKIRNRGMELELDTRQAIRRVDLRLGANLSFNRNTVLDLGGDKEFFRDGVNGSLPTMRNSAIIRVGEPLGSYYGYIFDGIYQDAADLANSPKYAGAAVGREKLRDINGRDPVTQQLTGKPDGKIDSDDKTILGNAQPKYILGQFGSASWGPINLSYVLRAVQGFKVVNLNRQGMESPGSSSNTLRSTLNYWSPTNPTNSMTGIGIGPYPDMTSRWIEDGSFVRLQNLTFAWNVPERYSQRAGVREARLYLSGQNLYTWTKYTWYDPEASSRGTSDLQIGWDDSSYPGVRTFTIGWNFVF